MPPNQAPLVGGGPSPVASSSSWFVGAPISKLCCVATVVFYVLFHAKSAQEGMAMDSFRMLRASQYGSASREWHRYWSSKLTFGSTGELVMGGMLLMILARQFEREMGSRKFGLFMILANLCAIGMEIVFVGFSTLMKTSYRYQGPYALLGALVYLYHRYTPRLHPRFFGILGFTFSEKSFYYLWFFQVIGYRGWNTIIASLFGWITAYVYVVTNLHESLDLPEAIAKPLTSLGAHLSEPPQRILAPVGTRGGRGGGPDAMAGMQRLMRNNNNPLAQAAAQAAAAQRPIAPPATPDPGAIEQLTSMGFDRQRVMDALQATNNNVERAADILLSS